MSSENNYSLKNRKLVLYIISWFLINENILKLSIGCDFLCLKMQKSSHNDVAISAFPNNTTLLALSKRNETAASASSRNLHVK